MGSCLARPTKSPTSAPISATPPQQKNHARASAKATSHGSVQEPVEAKRRSGRQSESRVLGGGPVALQPLKADRQIASQAGRDAHQSMNKTSTGAGVGAHAHAGATSREDAKEAAFRAAEARAQGVKGGALSQKLQAQRGKSGQALRMEESEAERRRRESAMLVYD